MSFSLALLFVPTYFLACEGATVTTTSTPLPAVLTGDCTSPTRTYAKLSRYIDTRATATNLVNGIDLQSIYSTSSVVLTYYSYLTLGCQSSALACCPSEALSTTSITYPSGYDHVDFTVSPLTACPADHATVIDPGFSTDSQGNLKLHSSTKLCCPSSWEIWPTQFPDLGDVRNCYQPWPEALLPPSTTESQFAQQVRHKREPQQQSTNDYLATGSAVQYGEWQRITLGVRMSRSYRLVQPKGPKVAISTGVIIGIAVPLGCIFIGTILLYWVYKSREKKKKKLEEAKEGKPGVPEIGEGLRHELEPGTKMAAPGSTETRPLEIKELHDKDIGSAILQTPWSDGPLHELEAKDLREMDTNVPAAHEVVADDWRIVP